MHSVEPEAQSKHFAWDAKYRLVQAPGESAHSLK